MTPNKSKTILRKQAKKRPPKRGICQLVKPVLDTREALHSPLRDVMRERFCQALLTSSSATEAAIRAGYSVTSARNQASRLCTFVDIQRRLAGLLEKTVNRSILRRRDVLRNASARANAALTDITKMVGLPWDEFAEKIQDHPAGRAIKRVRLGMEYDKESKSWGPPYVKDLELFDPRGSERLLADLLGWDAPKRLEVTPGTAGIIMLPAQEKPPVGVLPDGFWASQSLGTEDHRP